MLLFLLATSVDAATLTGHVIKIADGDTLTVLVDHREVKVRLTEIDAPEKKQPFGNKSKQSLSDLCFNKTASLEDKGKDRYKRTLARVHCDGVDANAEQIRRGMAWVYDRYVTDRSLYRIQDEAKAERRGLWADPGPVPPWVWRKTGGQKAEPEGCVIKGNINSKGQRIYHVPSRSSYGSTRIDESKGERWFCTEQQALSAGWRAPRQ